MIEGWLDGLEEGWLDGRLDALGTCDAFRVGKSLTDGPKDGCEPVGTPDTLGTADGWELGSDEGIDVGQSLTEGFIDGCVLGWLDGCEEG